MTQQACVVSNLGLAFATQTMFENLNFTLIRSHISALIGANGQGKSLLMQLLQQKLLRPSSGLIQWQMPHAYLAQFNRVQGLTIAESLGVAAIHHAFKRLASGQASSADYLLLEGKWQLPSQWERVLNSADLPCDLDFEVKHLSEGQQCKLALCHLFMHKDHYLLLDEPSNHLDQPSRQWLIQQLKQHPSGALIISHDRPLLDQVAHIYHLDQFGLHHSTGNYQQFNQCYQQQIQALSQSVAQHKREIKQLKQSQHQVLMKAEKREQQAKKLRSSHSQAKVLLDFKKEQASQSLAAQKNQQQRKLLAEQQQYSTEKTQLAQLKAQTFDFVRFKPRTGEILRINDLKLNADANLRFNLALQAGEKIHLLGANGSGKSTLLKTIAKQNHTPNPSIYLGVACFYLDQNFSFLNQERTVVENLTSICASMTAVECRQRLGQLRIRGDKSTMLLQQLSGGEKLKVALLALSCLSVPAELLLLDEPENHLDIESRQLLASAIRSYSGAMILVSHDASFVEDCQIKQHVPLHQG